MKNKELTNELSFNKNLYSLKEIAKILNTTEPTINEFVKKNNIEAVKVEMRGERKNVKTALYDLETIKQRQEQQQLIKSEKKADKINKNFTDEEVLIAFGNNLQEKNPEDILKLSIQMMGLSLTKMKNANDIEFNALKNENENLKIELGKSKEYYSVKKVSIINNKKQKEYDWRLLKRKSLELNREIKVEQDNNYDKVNSYHIDVWKEVYPDEKY